MHGVPEVVLAGIHAGRRRIDVERVRVHDLPWQIARTQAGDVL